MLITPCISRFEEEKEKEIKEPADDGRNNIRIQQHTQKELRNCCLAIHTFELGQASGVKATVKPQQKGDETGAGTDGEASGSGTSP
jgi:hypothetical protein